MFMTMIFLKDYPIHIDVISMGLPTEYFIGSVPEECLFLAKRADPDEMQHSYLGIRYAKLFEAAKSMFKS